MKARLKQWVNKQLRYSPYFYHQLKMVQRQAQQHSEALQKIRDKRFVALVNAAYQKSSFYRDLYDEAGVDISRIRSTHDITRLPIITKQDLRDHTDRMFIGNPLNRVKAYTSGTSGKPLQVYRDYQSTVQEWAYQWQQRIAFGHHPGMRTVVLRGDLKRDELERYDRFTKSLYLSSYHLTAEKADWYYEKIRAFDPHALYAYPSAAESLAGIFQALNKPIQIPLIFTSSETLYGHQRTKIEQVLDGQVADWYGNAERSIALAESPEGHYEELPLYSINEFFENHALGTSLTNFSLPIIRYRVDDVIRVAKDSPLQCGQRQVEAIQGRSDDVLLLPDGSRIGMIWGAFDRVNALQCAQIIQEKINTFQVNLVVCPNFDQQDEVFLRKKLIEFVGPEVPFTLSYVAEDQIIKAKSGKYKLVVNRLLQ